MSLFKKSKKEELSEEHDVFEIVFEDTFPVQNVNHIHAPHALTSEELTGSDTRTQTVSNSSTGALESLKKRISNASLQNGLPEEDKTDIASVETVEETTETVEVSEKTEIPEQRETLLDKCKPYIVDENGNEEVLNKEPLYKLQSVADILKSDSEKVLESLSKNYDISFDDLGNTKQVAEEPVVAEPEPPKKEIFEEEIPNPDVTETKKVISDIDFMGIPEVKKPALTLEPDATITFTPVTPENNGETQIKVSTHTKAIDLTNELIKITDTVNEKSDDEIQLEQNDFEDYIPETEYTSQKDIRKLKRNFSIKKRKTFLVTVFTFFITAILSLAKIPVISDILISNTFVSMIVCTSLAGINILLNMDMFLSFSKIFSKNSGPDISSSLASIFTLAYAVMGIIKETVVINTLLLLSLVLCFRSLRKFFKASYMLSNFSQISSPVQKKAVKLINDPAITFSMAKNAIEGDVLIAAAQKTNQISDFMKYSTYGSVLGGRLPVITALSLVVSAIIGFAGAAYFDGVLYGLYAATAIQLLTALPCMFFIDTLPLYRSAKRLNKMGAMITGKIGAEHLEMSNAVVLSSNDLFPNGTVTLHQMKVLSENNLDDTLIRAAALTDYMSSTLAPIFKKIVMTGDFNFTPDTDTVKYEDRMGISGWVDNRLLFIGNRALMEAHGIEVPVLEVDRKILRSGYFPVYVATGDKACALLIIQYTVDPKISHELRTLTKIGVTLLINNTDPNLSEPMICDYLGLYEDSVKVMSAAGCHMYNNTVAPIAQTSAPAAYKGSSLALAVILNCATKIKRSNTILTVIYILSVIFGTMIFAYSSFGGSGTLLSDTVLLIYGLISTVISYFIYLTERP